MLPAFFFKTFGTNRRRNFLGIVKCIERFRRDPGGMGAQVGKMNKPVLLFTSIEPFKQGIGQKNAVTMLSSIGRGCGGMDLFSSFRKENSLPVQISRITFFFSANRSMLCADHRPSVLQSFPEACSHRFSDPDRWDAILWDP